MLMEKHEPVNLFAPVPLERDAVLDQMDRLRSGYNPLFWAIHAAFRALRQRGSRALFSKGNCSGCR